MYTNPLNSAERKDFIPAPAGWYNIYYGEEVDGKVPYFRSPCPGWLKVKLADGSIEFHAASMDDGYLDIASTCNNYDETRFGDEGWDAVPE